MSEGFIKNIIYLASIGILAIGTIMLIPKFSSLGILRDQLLDVQKKFDGLIAEQNRLEKNRKKYQQLGEKLSVLEKMIPSQPDLTYLIAELEVIARKRGIFLNSVSFTELSPERTKLPSSQGLRVVAIDLKVQGTYSGFKEFLRALEEEMRLMDVQEVRFSGGRKADIEGSGGSILSFNLRVNTYYFSESSAVKSKTK